MNTEQPKVVSLQSLTASHSEQINSNDDDISDIQGRLDTEKPKIVSLQSLTASHTSQINSNDDDLLALKGRLDTEEPKIVALQTLTASHADTINLNASYIVSLDERLDAEEPKIVALQSLTASHTTGIASNTESISNKQDRITSSTDLTCNSISTQLGSVGTTNFINGFEFTRAFNHNLQLNSGFDFDGVKTNIISYNRNTGLNVFNAKTQLNLRAGTIPFVSNITETGFKIGEISTATEALDVAGNILASGSIIASSGIINSVDIESGLSSLETQVNEKQDILQAGTNITIDGNIISSIGGSITQAELTTALDKKTRYYRYL